MNTNGSARTAASGRIPMPTGLFVMLVLGLFGAYVMPVAPGITVITLLGMTVIAYELLVSDKPADGTYPMRGRDAMTELYAELEERRAGGELFPFTNWHPLHRVLWEAQQQFASDVQATIKRL
jgi:hypothetical protein